MKINVLWNKEDTIALALSGGVDSIVLFDLLVGKYRDSYKKLVVFHINHGLREQSEIEEHFVRELVTRHNLECYVERLDMRTLNRKSHISEEMMARELRYAAFRRFSDRVGVDKIVTGHHKNDNLENVLLRILMGRSIDYKLTIDPEVEIFGLNVVRPLLPILKKDIVLYAQAQNLEYYEDETNFDDDYSRNYVRQNIVPILEDFSGYSADNVLKFANYYAEINEIAKKHVIAEFKKNGELIEDQTGIKCSLACFLTLESTEKFIVINYILNDILNIYDISRKAIFAAIEDITDSSGSKSYDLKEKIKIIKQYECLCICKIEKKCYNDKIEINEEDIQNNFTCNFNDYKIQISTLNNAAELGVNVEDFPLNITSRKEGDTIFRGEVKKKLSRLFIDEKIPKDIRDRLPVVRNKDGAVLGVLGINSKAKKEYRYYLKIMKG